MATVEELEKIIEQLSDQVASLKDGFEKFQLLFFNLIETEIVKTKQLHTDQIQATDIQVTNINVTEIVRGVYLPPNLIRNSYMNLLEGSKPAGYSVSGNVALEAVHPFTKGFEGPYVNQQPSSAAENVNEATESSPFWFGVYNKGARASRGGLADGWHSIPDGRVLKITGNNSAEHTCVFFPFERNVLANKLRFKAWLKISSGKQVGFGVDSGYRNVIRGLVIPKVQADASEDGWYQIDAVVGISEVTSLDKLAFSMGIEADAGSEFEVYLALPYVANVDNDTWTPSVSDMLSRDGLTINPETNKVGIGTSSPSESLEVAGNLLVQGAILGTTTDKYNSQLQAHEKRLVDLQNAISKLSTDLGNQIQAVKSQAGTAQATASDAVNRANKAQASADQVGGISKSGDLFVLPTAPNNFIHIGPGGVCYYEGGARKWCART